MFRITRHLINTKHILKCYNKNSLHVNVVRYARPQTYKHREREVCPVPPPPPPRPPKDDSALWGFLTLLLLTGGFAVYAKGSPEIRDWLSIRAPWFDDFIAAVSEENMSIKQYILESIESVTDYLTKGNRKEIPKECAPEEDQDKPKISAPERSQMKVVSADSSDACVVLSPPAITKNICEFIECFKDRAEEVVNNYFTATSICAYYNDEVEEVMINFTVAAMNKLAERKDEREKLVKVSLKNASKALAEVEELTHYLECGVLAPAEDKANALFMIQDYKDKIKTKKIQFEWENDRSSEMDNLVTVVEDGVSKYCTEIEMIFPEINYKDEKYAIYGNPDLLLYHSYRYVQSLQELIPDAFNAYSSRVDRAVESLPNQEKIKKELEGAQKKGIAELDKIIQNRYKVQNESNDRRLKAALKAQLERHQQRLNRELERQEKESAIKLNKMVAQKVAYEKKMFAKQINAISIKVKVAEQRLNAYLKADIETKRSQELWVAGTSLLNATKKGGPCVNIEKELNAIEKAAGDDKLVATVMKSIPANVRKKGIVPESTLRSRYQTMESCALKVALVEHDGAPLPIYFLSWIQSKLLFMKISGIPMEEMEKPPDVPSSELDTFDLLQRARFWMEQGNLALAIRYVSSLQGASKVAAAPWNEAARAYLETRQAAEAVLAHAAAMGLKYI